MAAPEKPKDPAGATPAAKPSPGAPAPGGPKPAPAAAAKPAPAPAKPGAPPPPAAAKPAYKVEPAKPPELRGADTGKRPVIVGMAGGQAERELDAKKLLESTKTALGGLFAKAQAKIAELKKDKEPDGAAPPAEGAAPAAVDDAEAAYASAAPIDSAGQPVPAPAAAPKLAPMYQKATGGNDHIVLRVGEGTGAKAAKVIKQKGVKDVKVDGDRLEFHSATNRTIQVFKALIEGHIELYGLERTTEQPAPGAAPAPAATPPAAPAPESAPPPA